MTALIGKEDRVAIEEMFRSGLAGNVKVLLFTSKRGCLHCARTRHLLEEVTSLTDKIEREVLDKDTKRERGPTRWRLTSRPPPWCSPPMARSSTASRRL